MTTEGIILATTLFITITGGIAVTRINAARRNRELIRRRLEELIGSPKEQLLPLHIKATESSGKTAKKSIFFFDAPLLKHIDKLKEQANLKTASDDILGLIGFLAILPLTLGVVFDLPMQICILASLALPIVPYIYLRTKAEQNRNKFLTQLPNAIDLMISVLRSGHSVPQAVKAVSEEVPFPCGTEFAEIFQRMNLGQSLPSALKYSVDRYETFELDLIRKACDIQQEVGGSLAELLEKTNSTLRQRLKLKTQIQVLTSPGKLSALICGILPLVVGIGFNAMNPNYLKPLFESNIGQMLLAAALVLEILGFIVMRKLSTFRI